jgi:hypothetical protein
MYLGGYIGKIISVVERNMYLERLGKFGGKVCIWEDLGRFGEI